MTASLSLASRLHGAACGRKPKSEFEFSFVGAHVGLSRVRVLCTSRPAVPRAAENLPQAQWPYDLSLRARKTALDNKRRGIEDAKSRARDAASGPEARAMRQNLHRLREALAAIDAAGNREEIRALDWVLERHHD